MDEDRQHYRRKIKELQLLFDISRILDGSIDLKDIINPVLRAMAENMGMVRGTITLLNRQTREIGIEAAYGLSVRQQEKGKYKIGEGITGKVVEMGEPMIIPQHKGKPPVSEQNRST